MIRRTLNIGLYDCKVVVCFAPDINEQSRKIHQRHRLDYNGDQDYACVIVPPESVHLYYLLYGTSSLTLNRFVHEITHLGGTILKDRGHELSGDDEPLAYLNGYLAEEIYKIMVKNQIDFIKPRHGRWQRPNTP